MTKKILKGIKGIVGKLVKHQYHKKQRCFNKKLIEKELLDNEIS